MSAFNAGANNFLNSPHKIATFGGHPGTERGKTIHINSHPKEARIIYASGKLIVVKNLEDPSDCFIYRGHSYPTTVAKFSPNGYWVASADTSGKVRVWSWDNPEHILKIEVPALGGSISDLDWDMESKRIVVCGESGGLMVKCFQWDTGNSLGEMVGHSKKVNSVAYKPTRPFRVFTGGEDFKTVHYAGPPFKMDHSNTCHTNFVNCVRYSPDGSKVVSVGSDKKIQFYDGATGQPTTSIVPTGMMDKIRHAGTVSSVAWSPDSSMILTSSADKTVKLWDVESGDCRQTFTFNNSGTTGEAAQISDMQVAVLWTATNHMISVSLNGNINVLNKDTPAQHKLIQGHATPLTCIHMSNGVVYTGSSDGVVCSRSGVNATLMHRAISSDKKQLYGNAHANKVVGLTECGGSLVSVGWDDCIRYATPAQDAACVYNNSIALNGQPTGIASCNDLIVVTTTKEIALYNTVHLGSLGGLTYDAQCVTLKAKGDGYEAAVGGSDNKTHIYSIVGNTITPTATIDTRSCVTTVSYSHSGDLLAIGDSGRQVEVYDCETWDARVRSKWVAHTSKITCVAWSPDDNYLASGSLDESIYVWNVNSVAEKKMFQFAHPGGVTGIAWMQPANEGSEEKYVISTGNDGTAVTWKHTP